MVNTRSMSMSKATKESDTTKIAENEEVPPKISKNKRKVSKNKVKCRPQTIDDEAFSIFMMKDYLKRYYETHAYPTDGLITDESNIGGTLEWQKMSDDDKNVWIQLAKERKERGPNLYALRAECYATYRIS